MMLGTQKQAGLLRIWLMREFLYQQEYGYAPTLLEFDQTVVLPEAIAGKDQTIVMRIDRVDTKIENGKVSAIIVDYKSTTSSFKTHKQLYALQATQCLFMF